MFDYCTLINCTCNKPIMVTSAVYGTVCVPLKFMEAHSIPLN